MMANAEHPILTREDLRQELGPLVRELDQFREEVRTHYATKADLYKVSVQLGLFVMAAVSVGVAVLSISGS